MCRCPSHVEVYASTPNPCVDGIIHTHLPTLCLVLSLYFSVQIQAVNAIGCSPLSPPLLARTRPLPPAPPPLECSAAGPQSLKLKWGENPGNTHTHTLYLYHASFGHLCQHRNADTHTHTHTVLGSQPMDQEQIVRRHEPVKIGRAHV